MCDKMAISAYILKIVENDPFSRLQMRAKEDFNRHQLFSTNKQYIQIKPMRNETNRWSSFCLRRNIGKTLILRPKLSQFSHFQS